MEGMPISKTILLIVSDTLERGQRYLILSGRMIIGTRCVRVIHVCSLNAITGKSDNDTQKGDTPVSHFSITHLPEMRNNY